MNLVNFWERWLDSLDSSGGHIAMSFLLILLGVAMVKGGVAKGEDIMMGGFGALLMALKTTHSNHARQVGNPPEIP